MKTGNIHIGTSGWNYRHWKGLYYPEKLAQKKWLQYYAAQFSCVEINSSFYRLPSEKAVTNWLTPVPKSFIFCPKFSRFLTQFKKLNDPEEPLERFFKQLGGMAGAMGPVLFQLPPQLPFNGVKTEKLFALCKNEYAAFDFALEVRHESWLSKEARNLMERYKIAFVIAQSGQIFPYAEWVTAPHIYLRFHGPGKLYASKYEEKTLEYYAALCRKWAGSGHEVYAFFNNDIFGYAVEDAHRLQQMCK